MNHEETTAGAQELLNYVNDFADSHGRFPRLRELPIKKRTVEYHFGSYETLIRLAQVGEKPLPQRKERAERKCRCGCRRILPRHRWFFYSEACEEKYIEKHEREIRVTEKQKAQKRKYRKIWHKCKKCKHKCKIFLPRGQKEPPAKVICKADSEYGEINEIISKSL